MTKHKWYVVIVGKKPGVYSRWSEVAPLVVGIPGAIHESFSDEDAARDVFEREGLKGNVKVIGVHSSVPRTTTTSDTTSTKSPAPSGARSLPLSSSTSYSSPLRITRSRSHPSPHDHIPRGLARTQPSSHRIVISDDESEDERSFVPRAPSSQRIRAESQTEYLPRVTAQPPSEALSYSSRWGGSSARSTFSSVLPFSRVKSPSHRKLDATSLGPSKDNANSSAKRASSPVDDIEIVRISNRSSSQHAVASGPTLIGSKGVGEVDALLSPLASPRLKAHSSSVFNSAQTRGQLLDQLLAGSDRRGTAPTPPSTSTFTSPRKSQKGKSTALRGSFTSINATPVSAHANHEPSDSGKGSSQRIATATSLPLGSTPVYYLVPANTDTPGQPACPNCDHKLPAAATLALNNLLTPPSSPEGVPKDRNLTRSDLFLDPRSPLKGEGSKITTQRPSPVMMYKPEEPTLSMSALLSS